jgi:hypothetical protein
LPVNQIASAAVLLCRDRFKKDAFGKVTTR